jgi:hypothetical protein
VVAPVIVFFFTLLQQSASGLTALYAFSMFSHSRVVAWDRVESKDRMRVQTRSPARLALMSFFLGTTVVALHHTIVSAEPSPSGTRSAASTGSVVATGLGSVVVAAAGCACIVGSLTMVVAVGAFAARSFGATSALAEAVLGVLSQPWIWLALTACYLGYLAIPWVRRT